VADDGAISSGFVSFFFPSVSKLINRQNLYLEKKGFCAPRTACYSSVSELRQHMCPVVCIGRRDESTQIYHLNVKFSILNCNCYKITCLH
jgi:hypothetical protein